MRRASKAPLAETEAPAVEARGLGKLYRSAGGTVAALRGVDLRIERGELVAIVGPSGCGKTTLLNCLAGLERDFSGEVYLTGVPLTSLSDDRRARLRARATGFIFQSFNLLPTLSAVENVELPLLISRVRGAEARARAVEMLATVGLADRLDHRPAALSGGQQQRVAIARALVNQPAIVWADEPTGNLDTDTGHEIMTLIRHMHQTNGQTFVVVTHDAEIASAATRLVRMRDGQIVADEVTAVAPSPERGGGQGFDGRSAESRSRDSAERPLAQGSPPRLGEGSGEGATR